MKIALIGYGKMGHMIEKVALKRGHEIVCIIDVDNQEDFDSEAFRSADVAIEFTSPGTAYQNVKKAFAHDVKVVSGSTGWMSAHEDEMRQLCAYGLHTLFWSSNFSVGVALFNALNVYLAKLMNSQPSYDVRVTETHHIHKLDAPSGTAKTLAGLVQAGMGVEPAVASVRVGEIAGIHTVGFEGACDRISIEHEAFSRQGFAQGAVLAATMTQGLAAGIYEFQEMIVKNLQ